MKFLPVRVSESLPPVTTHASGEASSSIEVANPSPSWARFTSNCGKRRYALKAAPIQAWSAYCWSASPDDCVTRQDADLDHGGCHRLAARLHGAERVGADQVGAESVFGARVCVSRAARRSDQSALVRRRRFVQSLYRKPTVSPLIPSKSVIYGTAGMVVVF